MADIIDTQFNGIGVMTEHMPELQMKRLALLKIATNVIVYSSCTESDIPELGI